MIRLDLRLASLTLGALGLGLLGPITADASPHDDDPKILDRKPPVPGTGYIAGRAQGAFGQSAGAASVGPVAQMQGLFDASGVQLLSWLTLADLGVPSANGNDCWGYVSGSGREYALMCTTQAMVVVEVTNPALPSVIATIPGNNSTWRDVKTYQNYAYVVSENSEGIQVVDLSNIDSGVANLVTTITGNGTDNSHNVAIDETSGFLYRTGGGSNGLRIYDLANPASPQYVGLYSARYVHDAQIVTYTSGPFAGRQVAFCCAGLNGGWVDTGLTVLDVTNKSNIQVLAQLPYPDRQYSHQGWLSEDRTLFYLGDELDEGNTVSTTTTLIFDVADLNNVSYVGGFDNGDAAIGHNMYTHNGLLFQANYTSGLRVFDVATNPLAPTEVAYFDSAPNNSATSFNGMWSTYPYLPSGTIICSDIERGLFVLSMEGVTLSGAASDGTLAPAGEAVTVTAESFGASPIDPNSVELVYDLGAGATSVSLTATGNPGEYTGSFPALPCGNMVDWYVTASTVSGATSTLPAGAPTVTFTDLVADGILTVVDDEMEFPSGWVGGLPGDTATSGQWTRGDPIGTAAQPEDDHTPTGTLCWFTGQGPPGGSIGAADVDDGFTTLLSPIIDMSALTAPTVSYWRWYSNDEGNAPNADVFDVEISANGGASWTLLERVGPAGPGTSGGWIEASFDVASVIAPTSQMRLRFIASDFGAGSIVEAAIDDFRVTDAFCNPVAPGSMYCQGNPNSTGFVGIIEGTGSNVVSDNMLSLSALQLPPNQFGFFVVSRDQAFVANPNGSAGNLCIGANPGRYNAQINTSGPFGEINLNVDLTLIPQPSTAVAVAPGDTWNFQCWHRDIVGGGQSSNFTRGYTVTFQ